MPPMITRHNAIQLHNPPGYHHVTVVESGRLAFLAGQCPLDAFGALVGAGELDLQIDQVAANAAAVLAAVGARPDQVVRSVVYVVRMTTRFLPRPGASSPFRSSDRRSSLRARSWA
jgi:enamine deaminase RidA (YjgF/YER057c/UK114 family)